MNDSDVFVSLGIRIISDGINEQIKSVAADAQKQMQAPFSKIEETITDTFEDAFEDVKKTVKEETETIQKEYEKLKEVPMPEGWREKYRQESAAIEQEIAKIMSGIGKDDAPEKVDLSEVFSASTDPVELLQQKIANVNLQMDAERETLAQLEMEFRKAEAGTKAFDTLSAKITASEGRIISYQERIMSIQAKLHKLAPEEIATKTENVFVRAWNQIVSVFKKSTDKVKKESEDTAKKTSNDVKKSTESSRKHIGMLGQSIKGAFKSTFIAAGLYGAFRGLKTLLTDAAKQNDGFADSLNQVKANLTAAFTPIIQSVMPMLNTLMSGLAAATQTITSFISGIFGKTYDETVAATKGMQKNADAAKSTADGLLQASFDEMNVLSSPSGGSSSDGGIDYNALSAGGNAAAEGMGAKFRKVFERIGQGFYDLVVVPVQKSLSVFDAPIAKFKELFENVGAQCAEWMEPISDWFSSGFRDAVASTVTTVTTLLGGLTDVIATVATTVWNALAPVINWFVTDGLPVFTEMWVGLMEIIGGLFEFLKVGFDTLWSGVVEPVFTLISGIITDVFMTFQTLWETYGQTTVDNIMVMFEGLKNTFLTLWNSFLKPIFDQIFTVLQELWTNHLQPLAEHIGEFVMKLINGAMEIYNQFIAPIVDWIVNVLGPPISTIFNTIISMLGTVFGVLSDVLGGVFQALGGLIDFIVGVFTGDWNKAWQGICDFFSGIWNAIWGIIKGIVNLIIDGINLLWRGIYAVVKGIVDAIGGVAGAIGDLFGQNWHFSMPADPPLIPKLANGGIVDQPTLAMIGDNSDARSNPEVVAPLNKLKSMMGGADGETRALLMRIVELLECLELIVKIGDETIAAAAVRGINKITQMTGDCPILV